MNESSKFFFSINFYFVSQTFYCISEDWIAITTMFNLDFANLSGRYQILIMTFAVFTLLDIIVTFVGLSVGCVELNPVVRTLGLGPWAFFRVLLLGIMTLTFLVSHNLLSQYSEKGLLLLRVIIIILDIFIVAVVFSGLFTIFIKISYG